MIKLKKKVEDQKKNQPKVEDQKKNQPKFFSSP